MNTTPSPPSSPSSGQATYYISPHSPTQLRFPPSSQYTEWRGRCFHCCRTGHNTATCRNPLRCGKCWGECHSGTRCTAKSLNPAALPFWSNKRKQQELQLSQPSAHDESLQLLLKPCPLAAPSLPSNRPKTVLSFGVRDQAVVSELTRLRSGVVFDTHGLEINFSIKDVASFTKRTQTEEKEEISIGMLARDRFLIILPQGLAQETFINATTPELWDAGFTFQPWSPLDGANLSLPEYKALLDLHGLPPHLFKEREAARAISSFSTYLGSVPAEDPANLSCWTVMVAVDRLECIPHEIEFHDAGLKFPLQVRTRNWIRSPLYKASDLPKPPQKFTEPTRSSVHGFIPKQVEDMIHGSKRVLLSLCEGRDLDALPSEIREFMDGTSPSAEISMAQVELIVDLPESSSRKQAPGSVEGSHNQSVQPPCSTIEPPQEIQGQGSGVILMPSNNNNVVAGVAIRKPSRSTNPTRIMPQLIQHQVQILKRPLAESDSHARESSERTWDPVLETSDSLHSHYANSGQNRDQDNILTAAQRTRGNPLVTQNQNKKGAEPSRDKAAHLRPRKGMLSQIPLKPAFKKMVKHSAAQK